MEPNQETPLANHPTAPANPSPVANPEIKPKNSHKLLFIILGVFIVLILVGGIAGAYYLNKDKKVEMPLAQEISDEEKITVTEKPSHSPTPLKILKSEELYTINLPEGWNKVNEIFNEKANYLNVTYENNNGDFIIAEINHPGGDPGYDEKWILKPNSSNSGFIITEEKQCDKSKSLYCQTGNNKLSIIITPNNYSDTKLNGNYYFFQAGNKNTEVGINTHVYKNIIESMVFK